MADSFMPWIAVNEFMSDEYRSIVIKRALSHLPQATYELKHFACLTLDKLKVPGFRSFALANSPASRYRVIPVVAEAFQDNLEVAAAIICLWAEASREIIEELRLAATAAKGLTFVPELTWDTGRKGYIDFAETVALAEVADSLAADRPHPESDDIRLAVLWLGQAQIGINAADHSDTRHDESTPLDPPPVLAMSESQNVPLEAPPVEPTLFALAPALSTATKEIGATESEGNHLMTTTLEGRALVQIQELLTDGLERLVSAQSETRVAAQALCSAADASDLSAAERLRENIGELLEVWRRAHGDLADLMSVLCSRMDLERQARPDLALEGIEPTILLPSQVQAARAEIVQILAYDNRKETARADLLQQITQIDALLKRLTEWGQAKPTARALLHPEANLAELTLAEIQNELAQVTARRRELGELLHQLHTETQKRSLDLAAQLRAEGESGDSVIAEGLQLDALSARTLSERSDVQLRSIESHLVASLEACRRAKVQASQVLATALQEAWSPDGFSNLLASLVHEKRDEAMLLLLFSGGAAHLPQLKMRLSDALFKSLATVTTQWSSDSQPFELFAWLAPDFIRIGTVESAVAQARLCLMLLGAQYGGEARLPTELVWETATEWPLPSMPAWTQLWEVMAAEEALPPITSSGANDDDELPKARSRADHNLAREKAGFQRVLSLQSMRHRAMFAKDLMPPIAAFLARLEEIETAIRQCSDENAYSALMLKLESLVNGEIIPAFEEDKVQEWYESAINAADIDDTNSFHRRTALRLLHECTESVIEYGRLLLRYAQNQVVHKEDLHVEDLLSELASTPELIPLAQTVLAHIAGKLLTPQEWSEADAQKQVAQLVVHRLLSDGARATKMPHLVGNLIENEFRWAALVAPLLLDLIEPADPQTAVSILIEHDALNQALLVPGGAPPEQRKQIQMQSLERDREVNELQTALMKLGGTTEDLADCIVLGRWRFARKALQARLAQFEVIREAEIKSRQQQALHLRREINELDSALFEASSTMPQDVYVIMEHGLVLARQALGRPTFFNDVQTFVKDIRYRLDHASFSLADLQVTVDHLEQNLRGETVAAPSELTADNVLDLLQRGEFRRLGLNPASVTGSEIETRCELLQSWIQVRSLKGFLYEELLIADREAIQRLIQFFAQMVSLKHERTDGGRGKPIAYESPFVFSQWRMQYPETNVLDNICVLLALPGQPPSPRHLRDLEQTIESKQWLEGEFVLVFAPGCTPAIKKRLQTNYNKRGLLVIDEHNMLDLVLAEVHGSTPIGRLRPKMLNACEAESVDVFKVNQLVNPRTAIFVGRDTLITRLARSGDSYALYGGRRIGKSSILAEVQRLLDRKGVMTVLHSWEGEKEYSDDACAVRLANHLKLETEIHDVSEFKAVLQDYLDRNPNLSLVLLLDEIDKYIMQNRNRHGFIEALRSLSDRYGGRFRVIVAGFVSLYDCLHGHGPYTPTSDPWARMFNDLGPIENLRSVSAEKIVREGFIEILGWSFESRSIPQLIVQRTGGHPAFVQEFCRQLQHRVGRRDDRTLLAADVEAVFADRDPEQSFVAYVRKTLEMNLDAVSRYLLLWLAKDDSGARGFTIDQMREYASVCRHAIPDEHLQRSLERLVVNSVVKERTAGVYEFTVPDYPLILAQLGQTIYLEKWEQEIEKEVLGDIREHSN
jgi:hypothetical protein